MISGNKFLIIAKQMLHRKAKKLTPCGAKLLFEGNLNVYSVCINIKLFKI